MKSSTRSPHDGEASKTLIMIHPHMSMGGVERNFMDLVESSVRSGYDVIWLSDDKPAIDPSFRKSLERNHVTIIPFRSSILHLHKKITIDLPVDKQISIICTEPKLLVVAENLRDILPQQNVSVFFIMPHFVGSTLFYEQAFHGVAKAHVLKKIKPIFEKWNNRNEILFFSKEHAMALSEAYSLTINRVDERLFVTPKEIPPFDYSHVSLKSRNRDTCFNILSVSRFDFPHKAYVLGLLEAFSEVKTQYPYITLTVIGDGPGKEAVLGKIAQLPVNVQEAISLPGIVAPSEIAPYYEKAHLSIALAGALIDGAENSLLSIPARHYCDQCEVYGFLEKNNVKSSLLSEEKGSSVVPFIIEAITMDDNAFIDATKESYESCASGKQVDDQFLFRIKNNELSDTTTRAERAYILRLGYLIGLKVKLCNWIQHLGAKRRTR